jgi:hypothetical protein
VCTAPGYTRYVRPRKKDKTKLLGGILQVRTKGNMHTKKRYIIIFLENRCSPSCFRSRSLHHLFNEKEKIRPINKTIRSIFNEYGRKTIRQKMHTSGIVQYL